MLVAIIDTIIKVEDSVGWIMCNQHISVFWDLGDVFRLAVGDAITHKHWNSVEFYAVNLNSGVAEIVYVWVEAVDVRSIEAIVMIAADENFIGIRQVAEPVEEVDGLGFRTHHTEITGMYHHICFGQILKLTMASVGIREVKYIHK